MSTHTNQCKRVDILELSDSEKKRFIFSARDFLRASINEAKLWRTLLESDEVTVNGESIVF